MSIGHAYRYIRIHDLFQKFPGLRSSALSIEALYMLSDDALEAINGQ